MKVVFSLVILVLFTGKIFSQTTVTLNCVADANFGYHDGFSTSNANGGNALFNQTFFQPSASGTGYNCGRSVLKFDLSSIPSNAVILSATLDLYGYGPASSTGQVTSVGNAGNNPCLISRVSSSWTELGVTWNSQPTITSQDEDTLAVSTSFNQNYLGVDVTNMVTTMHQNQAINYGFMLHQLYESLPANGMFFSSRENILQGSPPVLHVTYLFHNSIATIQDPLNAYQVTEKEKDDFEIKDIKKTIARLHTNIKEK